MLSMCMERLVTLAGVSWAAAAMPTTSAVGEVWGKCLHTGPRATPDTWPLSSMDPEAHAALTRKGWNGSVQLPSEKALPLLKAMSVSPVKSAPSSAGGGW